ncbi:hypothetical protein LCGC14_0621990 [marine sediment metagenome]|uniref:Uncharacterized protein n=1 Tax=marine sediment metagenome TaxID=412755 RepID=A0A0F9RNV4_9ZZZZ
MCLDIVYKGKKKKDALAKLPESGYYWKLVVLRNNKYRPPIYSEYGSYNIGWNTTTPKSEFESYLLAYHLFCTKSGARSMKRWVPAFYGTKVIVRCKVRRKDIINIGLQGKHLTIVTKRIWIPKPRKKKSA